MSLSIRFVDRHVHNGYMRKRGEETVLRIDGKFQILENLSAQSSGFARRI